MTAWERSGTDSYYTYVKSQQVSPALIDALKQQGKNSRTGRARLCLHNDPSDPIHIMLIYHDERTIVPVHRHNPYGEFVLVCEGDFEMILYDENMYEKSRTYIGSSGVGNTFCFTPANVWHTLRFNKLTIFYEISQGPLDVKTTELATRS